MRALDGGPRNEGGPAYTHKKARHIPGFVVKRPKTYFASAFFSSAFCCSGALP